MYLRVIFYVSKISNAFPCPHFFFVYLRDLFWLLIFECISLVIRKDTQHQLQYHLYLDLQSGRIRIKPEKWPHSSENQAIRVFLACSAHFYRHLPQYFQTFYTKKKFADLYFLTVFKSKVQGRCQTSSVVFSVQRGRGKGGEC